MTHLQKWISALGFTGCLAACSLSLPNGHYGCSDGRCPEDMSCWSDGLCHSGEEPDIDAGADLTDAGVDRAVPDSAFLDAGIDSALQDVGVDTGAVCGNGQVDEGETCDDGNTETEAECPYGTPTCTACDVTCSRELSLMGAYCGDGTVDSDEACDDGNTETETECPYGTAVCNDSCVADCSALLALTGRVCGDDIVDPEEECDYSGEVCEACDLPTVMRAWAGRQNEGPWPSNQGFQIGWQSNAPIAPVDMGGDDGYFIDLQTGTPPILVSQSSDGMASADADVNVAGISADGNRVIFRSVATNLDPADADSTMDVYLWERSTGAVRALNPDPMSFANNPAISGNGRFVSFTTDSDLLVGGNGHHVVLLDLDSSSFEVISVDPSGDPSGAPDHANNSAVDFDGNIVAFQAEFRTLVADDTNGVADIFVRDRVAGVTTRVSVGHDGSEADGTSLSPVISPNGRWVGFTSNATNLVPGDTNDQRDVFVFDRMTGTTQRATVRRDGEQLTDGLSPNVTSVSDAGLVAFHTPSSLVPEDDDTSTDVYVFNAVARTLEVASSHADGTQSSAGARGGRFSPDGSVIVFEASGSFDGAPGLAIYRREL